MTLDLAPIEARVKTVQVGNWPRLVDTYGPDWLFRTLASSGASVEFVTHARQDVEALLVEVKRLRAATPEVSV